MHSVGATDDASVLYILAGAEKVDLTYSHHRKKMLLM